MKNMTWSYFVEFFSLFNILFPELKNSKYFSSYDSAKYALRIHSYGERYIQTQKKTILLKMYLLLQFLRYRLQIFTQSPQYYSEQCNVGFFFFFL